MVKTVQAVSHIPDIAWIIALWKAIHGGDPAPDQVAAANIAAGALAYLSGNASPSIAVKALTTQFETLGLKLEVSEASEAATAPRQLLESFGPSGLDWHPVQVCYGVPPARKCVTVLLPRPTPRPE